MPPDDDRTFSRLETMAIDTWDPRQYDEFEREREQPFYDLLAMIRRRRRCASSIWGAAPAS